MLSMDGYTAPVSDLYSKSKCDGLSWSYVFCDVGFFKKFYYFKLH